MDSLCKRVSVDHYETLTDWDVSTSPSVYVVYSSLRATVTCDSSVVQTAGPSFDAITIGYSSRFLAYGTLTKPDANCHENVVLDGFHTIDFDYLYYHPITTIVTQKPGCPPYTNPRLSLPAELTSVDPVWASCEPLFYGAFDPPRFLKKAKGGLVATLASQAPIPTAGLANVPIVSAFAQATPAPPTPIPTAVAKAGPIQPIRFYQSQALLSRRPTQLLSRHGLPHHPWCWLSIQRRRPR